LTLLLYSYTSVIFNVQSCALIKCKAQIILARPVVFERHNSD